MDSDGGLPYEHTPLPNFLFTILVGNVRSPVQLKCEALSISFGAFEVCLITALYHGQKIRN